MPLTPIVKNRMLNTAKSYFERVYLYRQAIGAPVALDMTLANPAVAPKIVGAVADRDIELKWGNATSTSVAITNSPTDTPIMWAVPSGSNLLGILLTDDNATESSRVIYGMIDKAPVANEFPVDGAHYSRLIAISLTEV